MKNFIRKFIPKFLLGYYHWLLAYLGAFLYSHPARRMIVIGVTGTKGKSTVVNLIANILEGVGFRVGLISTVNFKIGAREWANETKQTMPGRFKLQKLLGQMVKAGCQYAVIETSSEGIAQYRHLGIDYDVAVFTNLSPEHIESHGNYENYKETKAKLFKGLSRSYRKTIDNKEVKKISIVNLDDKEADFYWRFSADKRVGFCLECHKEDAIVGSEVVTNNEGISFKVNNQVIRLKLLGQFNVYNALTALAVGFSQEVDLSVMKNALEKIGGIPGRMEEIKNDRGFRIFIDYAHEPASLEEVYKTIKSFNPIKIISVLGSQGGGRDKTKRPVLGGLAAEYTNYVIITNEDPYDEEPQQIIDEVAAGAQQVARCPVEKVLDREQAINRALNIAEAGDVIIITGKGSETVMAVKDGRKIPWDDRQVVRELLRQIGS